MTDLARWLEQQITEDEKLALDDEFALGHEFYDSHGSHPDGFESEIVYSSARVLAECAAKRQIIALMALDSYPVDVLQALALPYADREGYAEASA